MDLDRVDLPVPTQSVPLRDEHVWQFPNSNRNPTHVRMRAWPTKDGGHLVVGTDYMLGGGLINMAESFYNAVVREFGQPVTVVRHFPARTMTAGARDRFDLLELNERGIADWTTCTDEVLALLGPGAIGFPGDFAAEPGEVEGVRVPAQSVHLGRLQAALIRLEQVHGTVVGKDVDPISQLTLGASALERLAKYLANTLVDEHDTAAGAKRERKLEKVVEVLQKQAWELTFLHDELLHQSDE